MAAQARYDDSKQKWLEAAKEAQSEKDNAKAAYDSEKADGITEGVSFQDWVVQNYPSLSYKYNNYQAAEAQYTHAFQNLDGPGAQEWQSRRNRELMPLIHNDDPDKRCFIILVDEE
ncbi:hypothetical protein ACHAPI_007756 [Fusarium lateritium]